MERELSKAEWGQDTKLARTISIYNITLTIAHNAGGIAVSQVMVINLVSILSVSLLNPLRDLASFHVTTLVIIMSTTFERVKSSCCMV